MRYALYFTPPEDAPLTRAANRWLGRNAFSNEAVIGDPDTADLTEEPRRYGFHATLKAPFELAASVRESELVEAIEDFAAKTVAFEIPTLVLGQLGPFFALVPAEPYPELQAFAASVVRAFEPYRAELSASDLARRKPDTLDERKRANLLRWGYPYVMDEFRFHMTLTGSVPETEVAGVRAVLDETFSGFTNRPLAISGLALFVEQTRGAPFTVHSWLPLRQA